MLALPPGGTIAVGGWRSPESTMIDAGRPCTNVGRQQARRVPCPPGLRGAIGETDHDHVCASVSLCLTRCQETEVTTMDHSDRDHSSRGTFLKGAAAAGIGAV